MIFGMNPNGMASQTFLSYKLFITINYREEEGIELQVLSNKPAENNSRAVAAGSFVSFTENAALPSTDGDSCTESGEFQQTDVAKETKPTSTIGKQL